MKGIVLSLAAAIGLHAQPARAPGDIVKTGHTFHELSRAAHELDDALARLHVAAVRHEASQADLETLTAAARAYQTQAEAAAHEARGVEGCDEARCGSGVGFLRDEAIQAERSHDHLGADWLNARLTLLREGLTVRELDKLFHQATGKVRSLIGSASTCR